MKYLTNLGGIYYFRIFAITKIAMTNKLFNIFFSIILGDMIKNPYICIIKLVVCFFSTYLYIE